MPPRPSHTRAPHLASLSACPPASAAEAHHSPYSSLCSGPSPHNSPPSHSRPPSTPAATAAHHSPIASQFHRSTQTSESPPDYLPVSLSETPPSASATPPCPPPPALPPASRASPPSAGTRPTPLREPPWPGSD